MGITQESLNRINKHIKPNSEILIVGCQNIYSAENYGEIAEDYFEKLGHDVISIDILGCQGSYVADLRGDLSKTIWWRTFDLVLQHGTVEHIDGPLYQAFKNLHESCKKGGILIHENPESASWPLHCPHYFTMSFYRELAIKCNYSILEIIGEAAMGNTTDGWNVCAVFKKVNDEYFISEQIFNEIYADHIKSE